jgi:hypothetical protein
MQRSNLSSTRGTALVEHQRANARRPISPWFCFTKYAPTLSSNFNRCIFEEQHLLCLPAQDQVIVAAPDIRPVSADSIEGLGEKIEQPREDGPVRSEFRIAWAFIDSQMNQFEAPGNGMGNQLKGIYQRVENGRERGRSQLTGIGPPKDLSTKPDMERMRGPFRDEARERARIRGADEDKATGFQRREEAL